MTADTITADQLARLARELYRASDTVETLKLGASRGDISPAYAASEIRRIMAKLNKLTQ